MAAIGEVWRCPFDFIESTSTFYVRGGHRELTKRYRQEHAWSEYEVKRLGKFRPVVVLGLETDNDRCLIAPLYSLHDGARVTSILLKQLEMKKTNREFVFTCVEIQPIDVTPMDRKANSDSLTEVCVARVDEVRAVEKAALEQCLGTLSDKKMMSLIAGYLSLTWSKGIDDALSQLGYLG